MLHGYRMNAVLGVAAVALAAALTSCGGGGSSGVTGPGGASGPMSARVDGVQWNADELGGGLGAGHPMLGMYTIPGRRTSGRDSGVSRSHALQRGRSGRVRARGELDDVRGGAIYGNANAAWNTPLSGMAGTAIVTTLTATRIAGTFAFQATPLSRHGIGHARRDRGHVRLPDHLLRRHGAASRQRRARSRERRRRGVERRDDRVDPQHGRYALAHRRCEHGRDAAQLHDLRVRRSGHVPDRVLALLPRDVDRTRHRALVGRLPARSWARRTSRATAARS